MAELDTNGAAPAPDWKAPLASDPEIAPHLPNISEKDLPTFVKSHLSLQKKMGDAIYLKDEPSSIKQKLYEKGILSRPPDSYEIKRPDSVPEHAWHGELIEKFQGIAKKHGLSAEAVNDLLALEGNRFESAKLGLQTDRDTAEKTLKETWLKEGKVYEQQIELGGRAVKHLFSEDEVNLLNQAGIGDHPRFLAALAKVGEAMQEDSGVIGETGAMSTDAKTAATEANDIIRNKANPKYEAYHRGDKEVGAYVEQLMKKAYPGTLEI